MGGLSRKTQHKPASAVHSRGHKAAARHARQPQPGLVERMIGLQNMIGNTAVNLIIEGSRAIGMGGAGRQVPQQDQPTLQETAPGQPVCYPEGNLINGPVDPWGAHAPCAPLEQRLGKFRKMLDDVWNSDIDRDKKMMAYGDWDQYFTEGEFGEIQKKDYGIQRRYEEYKKVYDPGRPDKPKEWGPMSVTYGDDSDQARAEMRGDTLNNMTSSVGGGFAEWMASWFTDDERKLNAASSLGATITDMAGATAGTLEARGSHPALNESRPEITTVAGTNNTPMETPSPAAVAHPEPATTSGTVQGNEHAPATSGTPADPVRNATTSTSDQTTSTSGQTTAPKITRLPPGPRPPEQTIRVKDEPLPEGTHKISNTTRPRTKRLSDEQALRANMERDGIDVPEGHAAHHMVLKRGGGEWGEIAREQMDRLGIGINDADNGIPLPGTNRPRGSVDEPIGGPYHGTIHTKNYYKEIATRMARAKTSAEGRATLRRIRQDIIDGKFPH